MRCMSNVWSPAAGVCRSHALVTGASGGQGRVTLGLIVSCNSGLEVKNTVLSGSNQCCQLWPAQIRACPLNEFMLVAKVVGFSFG